MNRRAVYQIAAWVAVALVAITVYGAVKERLGRMFRDQNAPFARFAKSATSLGGGVVYSLNERVVLTGENAELKRENAELRARMLDYGNLERDNAELRASLGLAERHPKSIGAEVVSRDGMTSGWLKTVRINKGERDGVRLHAPVVNENGLVGRVYATTRRTADVLLLADPNSSVSCYVEREGVATHGVLVGGGFGGGDGLSLTAVVKPLAVDFLNKDIEIRKGDKILTSGLGGVFPRGLPVGEVTESASAPSGLYKTAAVAPYADFRTLSLVFVLQTGDSGTD
ncbi:MAG: rod shape-determining protein MreC [Kiritimatiellaeota bacterium]|nr:rod shape-determining protein MreC [Kiritimatiellota bacterium]